MATLSLPIASGNFANGQPALGTDVYAQDAAIATFINAQNIDSNNVNVAAAWPWTGTHSWTISSASTNNLDLAVGSVMNSSKYGFKLASAQAQVNSALVYGTLSNASSSVPIFEAANSGTGSSFKATATGDAPAFEGTSATSSNTTDCFKAVHTGTGNLFGGTLRTFSGLKGVLLSKAITSSTTVSNTATETVISNLTMALPANFLKVGTTVRGKIRGFLSTPGSGVPSARIRVFYGTAATPSGTALLDTGAVTHTTSLSGSYVDVDFTITCRSVGASGTVEAQGITFWGSNTAPAGRGMGTGASGAGNTGTITIDTTAANDLYVSFVWGSAVASTSVTFDTGHIELLQG